MDWKFIMCLLVMCSTTIWKLLEILTYGEIQVRQVFQLCMSWNLTGPPSGLPIADCRNTRKHSKTLNRM